jgi:hypothetical protein
VSLKSFVHGRTAKQRQPIVAVKADEEPDFAREIPKSSLQSVAIGAHVAAISGFTDDQRCIAAVNGVLRCNPGLPGAGASAPRTGVSEGV